MSITGTVSGPDPSGAWLMQIGGPPAVRIDNAFPCSTGTGTFCSFADAVALPYEHTGAIYTFALYPWVDVGGSGTPAVVSIVQEDGGPGPG